MLYFMILIIDTIEMDCYVYGEHITVFAFFLSIQKKAEMNGNHRGADDLA